MKILIDILHPAHVHIFKHFHAEMTAAGHEIAVIARDKDVATALLKAYAIPYVAITVQRPGVLNLGFELLYRSWKVWRVARRFRPDLMIGCMGPSIALASRFLSTKCVVLYDNETSRRINQWVSKVADEYWTPEGFQDDLGKRHYRVKSYHALAYLSRRRFTPDASVLQRYGLSPVRPFFIVRLVSWKSIHDIGESGFSPEGQRALFDTLTPHGDIVLSSEAPIPTELQRFDRAVRPEDMHHLLAYSRLLICESATMAAEAAVLGTPAIFVSKSGRGIIDDIAAKYGLVKHFTIGREADVFATLISLLANPSSKPEALEQARRLAMESEDYTGFLIRMFGPNTLHRETCPASPDRRTPNGVHIRFQDD